MDHVARLCSHAVILNEGTVGREGRAWRPEGRYGDDDLETLFLKLTARPATAMTGAAIGFWRTVRLLSRTARQRSRGRRERQRQLLNNRSGPWATDWGSAGVVLALLIMVFLHGLRPMR